MKRPIEIEADERAMATLVNITGVFEGLASMQIAKVKNQVVQASEFFKELWQIYTQLRVSATFGFGRSQSADKVIDKNLFIIITAEGGFSGDIDQKLIKTMLKSYQPDKTEIIVIGHHGAIQLAQRGIAYKKYFKLPVKDQNINVGPIIREVQKYDNTTVFYQEYISLMVQDIKKIELSSAVQQRGKAVERDEDIITEANYIFEPSTYDVVDHLEQSMMQIAISQLILESKLAQYASRFRAMSASHERAEDAHGDLRWQLNRTRRAVKDERLKELTNGIRKLRSTL